MQAGLRVHTYPEVLFTAANLTAGGGDCNPDKPPLERHISFGSASNILGDPEEVRTAFLYGSHGSFVRMALGCKHPGGYSSTVSLAAAPSRWVCLQLNAMQNCQLCPTQYTHISCVWEGYSVDNNTG